MGKKRIIAGIAGAAAAGAATTETGQNFLTRAFRTARDGAIYAYETAVFMGEAVSENKMTALKCFAAAAAAATIPLAVDGAMNFGPALMGKGSKTTNFEAADAALTRLMGVDTSDPDKAIACAAGKIPGMVVGAGATLAVTTALTGGAGAVPALKATAATIRVVSGTNAMADVIEMLVPKGPS